MVLLLLLLGIIDPPIENPYRNSKVGDWVTYRTTGPGTATTVTGKHTVVNKTPDEVVIKTEISVNGTDAPPAMMSISLKEPFNPLPKLSKNTTMTAQKLDSGSEVLQLNGEELPCMWTKTKYTTKVKYEWGKESTTVQIEKVWTSKKIPLDGRVRSESEESGISSVTELTGYGIGK